ncbi:MAG: HesA/MoeB/ThiF family protein [Deltaproteobacteria bacterium]|nr:HesA/MoeB/ThiF family protein [Deltaproteobacteria bacterium]
MTRVLIVGVGGLGCPVAWALARSPDVAELVLVDSDRVDVSNLHRQVLHGIADVGRPKVESAREALTRINGALRVSCVADRFDLHNAAALVARADVVIDGSDSFRTKFLVNDACVLAKKPFVIAGVQRFEGQVLAVRPGDSACYRCLFERPPPRRATLTCQQVGVLGAVAGFVGFVEAAAALHLIADESPEGLIAIDALNENVRTVRIARDRSCAVCGDTPKIRDFEEENYRPQEDDDDGDNGSCSDPA